MVYNIYTLTCPIDNIIKYVGKTQYVNERLKQHIYNDTLLLKEYKQTPIIEIIDSSDDYYDARNLEIYWIHQFRSWGFNLLNRVHNYKNEKPIKMAKQSEIKTLTEKEITHIKNSLKHGNNKIVAAQLGIKSPAFSRYLKAIPTYNPKTRKFDFGYRMPNKVYNAITNFINSK